MVRFDFPENAIGRSHYQRIFGNKEPTFDVTSWEAQYCIEKGIPLLSDEARHSQLILRQDFPQDTLFMIRGAAAQGTTGYLAMDFPDGVLLFSNSAEGKENLQAMRQYMCDHYFNPQFNSFYLCGYVGVVLPDPKQEKKVDTFKDFYPRPNSKGHLSMPQIPQEILCERSVLDKMVKHSNSFSDKKPSFEEFSAIGKNMKISPTNADIAYWQFIKEEGYPPVEYQRIAKPKDGIDHTVQMLDVLSKCNDPEQASLVREQNMESARKMLAARYPNIRGVDDCQIRSSQSASKPKLKL